MKKYYRLTTTRFNFISTERDKTFVEYFCIEGRKLYRLQEDGSWKCDYTFNEGSTIRNPRYQEITEEEFLQEAFVERV